jgi:hypothetical protein
MPAAIDTFDCAPELALGKPVHKACGGMLFGGEVQDFEIDAATGMQIWGVLCSDGDRADCSLQELRVLCLHVREAPQEASRMKANSKFKELKF